MIVNALASPLDFTTPVTVTSVRLRMAATMGALSSLLAKLNAFYEEKQRLFDNNAPQIDPDTRRFPPQTQCGEYVFTYKDRFPEKHVFLVSLVSNGNKPAVVKFVQGAYGSVVQHNLAQQGFAPKILYEQELVAWRMILMDRAEGRCYASLSCNAAQADVVKSAVGVILDYMATNRFVHGDIRSSNLFIDLSQYPRQVGTQLVDFDWAGQQGHVNYPIDVNTVQVSRADGVVPLGPIEPEHDRYMAGTLQPQVVVA
jgi:hypothetical protein